MSGTILIVDTETTGLPPKDNYKSSESWNRCRMVQIAWEIRDIEGKILEAECYIITPDGYSIPDNTAKIHGITTEIAHEKGMSIHTVIDKFNNALKDVNKAVAHNMKFDDAVILSELYRYGYSEIIEKWKNISKDCTMIMSMHMNNNRWIKLKDLYVKCFNKEPEGQLHQADIDVNVCADIYFHLLKQ